ncbi:hypothetical protein Tco_0819046 [Tanacetum coccineum]|uniref:Gag-Pol polyprotein n=1 Tax=Tanacetum coccineum TaxID=301880 RepID=A0ABQ5A8D4_9ASTR
MPVQTRRQLATDPKMCIFALTKSISPVASLWDSSSDFRCPCSTQVFSNLSDGRLKRHFLMSTEGRGLASLSRKGFVTPDHPGKSLPSKEAVYGLKKSSRAAFSDDDPSGDAFDTRKSTSGGIQFLGDKLVSWMSKKQNCTAMSSAEAEYVALSASCAQVMWMRTQLQDYGFNYTIKYTVVLRLSVSHSNLNATPYKFTDKSHPYSVFISIKEQVDNVN